MTATFSPAAGWDRLRQSIEKLYPGDTDQLPRYQALLQGLADTFGPAECSAVFSAPGRTEIGGNHTDHQHGQVLAGSVNLDVIAAVSLTDEPVIRVKSEGFPLDTVDLRNLNAREDQQNTSAAIIRGIAAWFAAQGCTLSGFNAYTTSNVLKGSGLSSSAAFEVLIANIINDLFCGGRYDSLSLAQAGQYAENVHFGKPSGLLDQTASSVGGMVTVDFADNDRPFVQKVPFDFAGAGHALCIVDSGADHADLTGEYAAVTEELRAVCAHFGRHVLREVPEEDFYAALPALRQEAGDRAVLRAIHIYEENRRVNGQVAALRSGNFDEFLALVRESGLSSWRFLQNITPTGSTRHQEVALTLALCEKLLQGQGACRVHGGGFAGTVQAFVPTALLERFRTGIEAVLGSGSCHVLSIRPVGGARLA